MTHIYSTVFHLNSNRMSEIINRVDSINNYYYNKYINNSIEKYDSIYYNLSFKFDKSISIYKRLYKEDLDNDERTLLCLYILFPNDTNFLKLLDTYKYDFKKISDNYGVNENFIFFRYKIYRELRKTNDFLIKKLKKENC